MKHSIFKQIIIAFLLVIAFASITAALIGFIYNAQHTVYRANYYLEAAASMTSEIIEGIDLESLEKSDKSDLYVSTKNELKSLCDAFDLQYLYIYEYIEETGNIRYIISVSKDDNLNELLVKDRGLGKTLKHDLTQQEKNALAGEKNTTPYIYRNQYGQVYTWSSPVIKNGKVAALVGCDYYTSDLLSEIIHSEFVTILPMIGILVLAFLLALFILQKRIIKPIRQLSTGMSGFISDEGIDKCEPINVKSKGEIGDMVRSFQKMSEDIINYIDNIKALTAERERTRIELDVANRIQKGIVPENSSIEGHNFDVYACALPAKEVGGDFYDCFKISDRRICAVVGDVSGKGIAAAMFMAMTKTMIHDSLSRGESPAQTLISANRSLCESNPEGMFVTVFAAVFDTKTGEVCFANAGHTVPVVFGKGARAANIDPGIAIGLFDDAEIVDERLTLSSGEGLLIYTDGATDSVNNQKEFFGQNRLTESVKNADSAKSAISLLSHAVFEFVSGAQQFDDYTALALFYQSGNKTKIQLTPDKSSLSQIRDAVFNITGNTPQGRKIFLACDEVFANIAEHSDADYVEFEIEKKGDKLSAIFKDNGFPFDPLAQNISKDFLELDGGGMGLSFIRSIAGEINYSRENDMNILTLSFDFNSEGE